ncbi:MAG: hypothetical protein HY756_07475 [Nitrospirae bacterium]|nr:hypothetical protein [Nitrospirota bacterium]
MGKRLLNNAMTGLAIMVTLIMLTAGCDRYARHKVLTFFFTGVPPLDEEKKSGKKEEGKAPLAKKKRTESGAVKVVSFTHGPFAAGQCNLCHDIKASVGFRGLDKGKKDSGSVPDLGQAVPGRLVTSLQELCVDCHIQKTTTEAGWVHGPVANGNCVICHSPHRSKFQYMLLKEKSVDLCGQCHSKENLIATDDHKKGEECVSCHNAHAGKNRFLLKKDFNEIF